MVSNTKLSPKSCSCRTCRRGKSTDGNKFMMRRDQRAYRHAANLLLRLWRNDGDDTPMAAPVGGYYD